jgi:4-hydroxythreonine-4-phosphate dehydrogenase
MRVDRSSWEESHGIAAERPQTLPRILVTLGDPAGIGSELVAKLLARPDEMRDARIVVLADKAELENGATIAGMDPDFVEIESAGEIEAASKDDARIVLLHRPVDGEGPIARAQVSERSGKAALAHLTEAVDLIRSGYADALLYAPLNKASLKAAGLRHLDEAHFFAETLGHDAYFGEVSILGHLCTTRVTSHIGLRDVADRITVESVTDAIGLAHETLQRFGRQQPRLAVCGLNPHAGDAGMLGLEEIEIIAPAIARMRETGLAVEGPFPADSIFPKAWNGGYDAVVTMYHDQGQIALKAIGFDRGVTIHGGFPIPIVTPAQGSAFDIVGKNVANPDAIVRAFRIAVTLAGHAIATRRCSRGVGR